MRAGDDVVVLGGVPQGVADVNLPVQDLDIERRVAGAGFGSVNAPAGNAVTLLSLAS